MYPASGRAERLVRGDRHSEPLRRGRVAANDAAVGAASFTTVSATSVAASITTDAAAGAITIATATGSIAARAATTTFATSAAAILAAVCAAAGAIAIASTAGPPSAPLVPVAGSTTFGSTVTAPCHATIATHHPAWPHQPGRVVLPLVPERLPERQRRRSVD